MSVLFILEMYMDCLGLAISSLKQDPGYVKANAFKDKIFELQPSLIQDAKGFFSDRSAGVGFGLGLCMPTKICEESFS